MLPAPVVPVPVVSDMVVPAAGVAVPDVVLELLDEVPDPVALAPAAVLIRLLCNGINAIT